MQAKPCTHGLLGGALNILPPLRTSFVLEIFKLLTPSAKVVGPAGGWGVVINYGRACQTLAATLRVPSQFSLDDRWQYDTSNLGLPAG